MTKSDFVFAVAERSGLTKKDAELAAGAVFDVLTQIMAQGDRLQFPGFGTFKPRVRPPFCRTAPLVWPGARNRGDFGARVRAEPATEREGERKPCGWINI